jgi:hypothetical protein
MGGLTTCASSARAGRDFLESKGPEYELEWFPTYPDKILSSVQWMRMTDFQRGWYWQILLKMTRSKPIGYLRLDDGQLWTLAGAHSRQYWETHAALVLACFKVAEFDGHRWIYNQKLLDVLQEQQEKHDNAVQRGKRKKNSSSASSSSSSVSYSREFEEVWEKHIWAKVSKKTAGQAFEKAMTAALGAGWGGATRELAAKFLADALEEFKNSDAGKEHGLFDGYKPPYPASWLNGQRYLDDRKAWHRTTAEVTGKSAGATEAKASRSNILPDCPACSGTGWKPVAGNRVRRCDCAFEKQSRDAANQTTE